MNGETFTSQLHKDGMTPRLQFVESGNLNSLRRLTQGRHGRKTVAVGCPCPTCDETFRI